MGRKARDPSSLEVTVNQHAAGKWVAYHGSFSRGTTMQTALKFIASQCLHHVAQIGLLLDQSRSEWRQLDAASLRSEWSEASKKLDCWLCFQEPESDTAASHLLSQAWTALAQLAGEPAVVRHHGVVAESHCDLAAIACSSMAACLKSADESGDWSWLQAGFWQDFDSVVFYPQIQKECEYALQLCTDSGPLNDIAAVVLRCIERKRGLSLQRIVADSTFGRTEVRRRLAWLEDSGYVHRPHGERSGYYITEAGRERLRSHLTQ